MYVYSTEHARTYASLGIEATTYEAGFRQAAADLGDLTGRSALDFGCGAGRTTRLLRSLGAEHVTGVDHNQSMIGEATRTPEPGLTFIQVDDSLPFPDGVFDVALAAHVFVEISTRAALERACGEVHRVLRDGGTFVIVTNNAQAVGRDFVSFRYPARDEPPVSGERMPCTIKKDADSFTIDDVHWPESDVRDVLETLGCTVSMTYPLAHGDGWLDETTIAPHVVIKAVK